MNATILYVRTSTIEQSVERQKLIIDKDSLVIEDKCSGAIPFFERDGGKKILSLIEENKLNEIQVHEIDRLGRNLLDILNTIKTLTEKNINLHCTKQGFKTLNEDGTENYISKMIISVLGAVSEMERKMIRERQLEGIAIAKANGRYLGRVKGTKESALDFLNKPKNKKAIQLLNKGYKNIEISKIVGIHQNTVTKIKKIIKKIEK